MSEVPSDTIDNLPLFYCNGRLVTYAEWKQLLDRDGEVVIQQTSEPMPAAFDGKD